MRSKILGFGGMLMWWTVIMPAKGLRGYVLIDLFILAFFAIAMLAYHQVLTEDKKITYRILNGFMYIFTFNFIMTSVGLFRPVIAILIAALCFSTLPKLPMFYKILLPMISLNMKAYQIYEIAIELFPSLTDSAESIKMSMVLVVIIIYAAIYILTEVLRKAFHFDDLTYVEWQVYFTELLAVFDTTTAKASADVRFENNEISGRYHDQIIASAEQRADRTFSMSNRWMSDRLNRISKHRNVPISSLINRVEHNSKKREEKAFETVRVGVGEYETDECGFRLLNKVLRFITNLCIITGPASCVAMFIVRVSVQHSLTSADNAWVTPLIIGIIELIICLIGCVAYIKLYRFPVKRKYSFDNKLILMIIFIICVEAFMWKAILVPVVFGIILSLTLYRKGGNSGTSKKDLIMADIAAAYSVSGISKAFTLAKLFSPDIYMAMLLATIAIVVIFILYMLS